MLSCASVSLPSMLCFRGRSTTSCTPRRLETPTRWHIWARFVPLFTIVFCKSIHRRRHRGRAAVFSEAVRSVRISKRTKRVSSTVCVKTFSCLGHLIEPRPWCGKTIPVVSTMAAVRCRSLVDRYESLVLSAQGHALHCQRTVLCCIDQTPQCPGQCESLLCRKEQPNEDRNVFGCRCTLREAVSSNRTTKRRSTTSRRLQTKYVFSPLNR